MTGCLPDLFAGMTTEQKQAALAGAQQAYVELLSGKSGVSFSYTQGNGTKSVTYTATNVANLVQLIGQLQKSLGQVVRARRPLRFAYRG